MNGLHWAGQVLECQLGLLFPLFHALTPRASLALVCQARKTVPPPTWLASPGMSSPLDARPWTMYLLFHS